MPLIHRTEHLRLDDVEAVLPYLEETSEMHPDVSWRGFWDIPQTQDWSDPDPARRGPATWFRTSEGVVMYGYGNESEDAPRIEARTGGQVTIGRLPQSDLAFGSLNLFVDRRRTEQGFSFLISDEVVESSRQTDGSIWVPPLLAAADGIVKFLHGHDKEESDSILREIQQASALQRARVVGNVELLEEEYADTIRQ